MVLKKYNLNEPERPPTMYRVEYLGKTYLLKSQNEIKINGIFFQQDLTKLVDENVDKAMKKTEKSSVASKSTTDMLSQSSKKKNDLRSPQKPKKLTNSIKRTMKLQSTVFYPFPPMKIAILVNNRSF
jgi:hypothetical protein